MLNLQSVMVKSFESFCGLVTFLYLNNSNLRPVKSFVDMVKSSIVTGTGMQEGRVWWDRQEGSGTI